VHIPTGCRQQYAHYCLQPMTCHDVCIVMCTLSPTIYCEVQHREVCSVEVSKTAWTSHCGAQHRVVSCGGVSRTRHKRHKVGIRVTKHMSFMTHAHDCSHSIICYSYISLLTPYRSAQYAFSWRYSTNYIYESRTPCHGSCTSLLASWYLYISWYVLFIINVYVVRDSMRM